MKRGRTEASRATQTANDSSLYSKPRGVRLVAEDDADTSTDDGAITAGTGHAKVVVDRALLIPAGDAQTDSLVATVVGDTSVQRGATRQVWRDDVQRGCGSDTLCGVPVDVVDRAVHVAHGTVQLIQIDRVGALRAGRMVVDLPPRTGRTHRYRVVTVRSRVRTERDRVVVRSRSPGTNRDGVCPGRDRALADCDRRRTRCGSA